MSVYGNFTRDISESSNITPPLGLDESEELKDSLLECLLFSIFSESVEDDSEDDITMDDLVEEGANLDYRAAFKSGKKKYKEAMKKVKTAMKSGNKKDAKAALSDAKKAVNDIYKVINDTDSTVGSDVLGYFAYGLLNLAEMLVPFSIMSVGYGISFAGAKKVTDELFSSGLSSKGISTGIKMAGGGNIAAMVGGIATGIQSLIILIKTIIQLVNDIKDPKTTTVQALNLYRNKLLQYTKSMSKEIDKVSARIDKL